MATATSVLLQAMHNLHSLGYSSLELGSSDVKVSVDKDLRLQVQLHGDFVPTGTGLLGESCFCCLLCSACSSHLWPVTLCMQLAPTACDFVYAAGRSEVWLFCVQIAIGQTSPTLGSLPALSWQHPQKIPGSGGRQALLGKKGCQQNYLTSAQQHPTCERSHSGVLLAACGWHLHLHLVIWWSMQVVHRRHLALPAHWKPALGCDGEL